MKLLFAADLHLLPGAHPKQSAALAALLAEAAGTDGLWLLGDLFHFWYERPGRHAGAYDEILSAFRAATGAGLPIHAVFGNRDFTMGPRLRELSGIEPHGAVHLLEAGGKRLLLTHGDLFCTRDRRYQLLRRLLTGRFGRFCQDCVPWSVAERVLARVLARPACTAHRPPRPGIDIRSAAAEQALSEWQADLILCGHVHWGETRRLHAGERAGELHVLDPWCAGGHHLLLDETGFYRRGGGGKGQ